MGLTPPACARPADGRTARTEETLRVPPDFPFHPPGTNPRAHRDLDVRVRERAALGPGCVGQGVSQLPAIGRHLQRGQPRGHSLTLPSSGVGMGGVTVRVREWSLSRHFYTCAVPPLPTTQPEASYCAWLVLT